MTIAEIIALAKLAGTGGASSWNDLTDKPFYEETETVNEPLNITWDGNTDGLVSVMDIYYKVSDLVLTDEQIRTVTIFVNGGEPLTGAQYYEKLNDNISIIGTEVSAAFVNVDNAEFNGVVFPKAGIYAMSVPGMVVSSLTTTEPIEQTKTVVKKIDEKFLPNAGGGVIVFTAKQDDSDDSRVTLSAAPAEIYAAAISNTNTVIEFTPCRMAVGEIYAAFKVYMKPVYVDDLKQICFEGYLTKTDSQNRRIRTHFYIMVSKNSTNAYEWVSKYDLNIN